MNAKTAKLINKFCTFNGMNNKVIKKKYNETQWNKRNHFKSEMREYLADETKVEVIDNKANG